MEAPVPVKRANVKVAARHARRLPNQADAGWQWRQAGDLRILQVRRFRELKWLVHGFSTRLGGASELESSRIARSKKETALNLGFTDWDRRERVEANRRQFLEALGSSSKSLITLRQIHSDVVHRIDKPPLDLLKGDALVTAAPALLLGVQTADCIPILLVDPRRRAVAAIHAGWRGTLSRVAAKTVGRMTMEFGTRPQDLLAALGPGIGPCCYEVGPEVVQEFASQFSNASEWFHGPFDALASGENPNPLPWLTMMPPGHEPPPPRCNLDLHAANSAILVGAGLAPRNIFATKFCTSCRTDLFFSYRREGSTGRMMAVIGLH